MELRQQRDVPTRGCTCFETFALCGQVALLQNLKHDNIATCQVREVQGARCTQVRFWDVYEDVHFLYVVGGLTMHVSGV